MATASAWSSTRRWNWRTPGSNSGPPVRTAPWRRVILGENEYGERILKTEAIAFAANHLGEIVAPPVVRRPYRAETHIPARMEFAVAA